MPFLTEALEQIRATWALKAASKELKKRDTEDFAIIVRTKNSSVVQIKTKYSDIIGIVCTIINQIALETDQDAREVMKEIETRIYRLKLLQIDINELYEHQAEYSKEEFQGELKKVFEKHEVESWKTEEVLNAFEEEL